MNYFARPEVSNSDLTSLWKYFIPQSHAVDIEKAYRFGSLVDAIITEPERVDFFRFTIDGEQYTKDEFQIAGAMKKAFLADPFCRHILENSEMQRVEVRNDFPIRHIGHEFRLDVRCKFDFFGRDNVLIDGDLKSTACLNQKSFEESIQYFDYDRQSAWYMDISGRDRFVFIGVSKKNMKIFKVPVKRGDAIYQSGRAKYSELAFKYWYMFGELKSYENTNGNIKSPGPEEVFEESF
jgi:hypothetical protein